MSTSPTAPPLAAAAYAASPRGQKQRTPRLLRSPRISISRQAAPTDGCSALFDVPMTSVRGLLRILVSALLVTAISWAFSAPGFSSSQPFLMKQARALRWSKEPRQEMVDDEFPDLHDMLGEVEAPASTGEISTSVSSATPCPAWARCSPDGFALREWWKQRLAVKVAGPASNTPSVATSPVVSPVASQAHNLFAEVKRASQRSGGRRREKISQRSGGRRRERTASSTYTPTLSAALSPSASIKPLPVSVSGRSTGSSYECDPSHRFLHLVFAREGMSAWTHILLETLWIAAKTGRILVEPCVAGGVILPCNPGRVIPLHLGAADGGRRNGSLLKAVAAGRVDPLLPSAFRDQCMGTEEDMPRWLEKRKGRSYPLALYMDVYHLQSEGKIPIVSFTDWEACQQARVDPLSVSISSNGVVEAPLAYCFSAHHLPGVECQTATFGRYKFNFVHRTSNEAIQRQGLPAAHAAHTRAAKVRIQSNRRYRMAQRGVPSSHVAFHAPSPRPLPSPAGVNSLG